MPRSTSSFGSHNGSAATVDEIVHSLTKRGCFDLTSSINSSACSQFPCAGGADYDIYRGKLCDDTDIAIKTSRTYDGPEAGRDGSRRKILKRTARELYHWSKLRHCNVLPLMGFAVFRGQISMISKWMENGSLALFLRLHPDANRSTICADICEGLWYLHANEVVHGCLKGANVMVSSNGIAKITDFGNTRLKDLTQRFSTTAKPGLSVRWAAPELLLKDGSPQASKESDIYAYGMTVLEVLTGKPPYEGISNSQIFVSDPFRKNIPNRPEVNMPNGLWDLLKSCWNGIPSERPKIEGVRDSLHALSWFPSNSRLTNGITTVEELVLSLTKRGCLDLTSLINSSTCSEFPCAGGGYCDVYRGALHDGTSIAIRKLRIYDGPEAERDSGGRKTLKRAARELYHWSKLQHCNVLPLMGLAVFRGQISMISKWMENGSLMSFLRLNQGANRPTICADICEGLCYLHANEAVHGDLKGANVMVSSNGIAMIADFGNTRLKDLTQRFSTTAKLGLSVRWAAPELLLDDSGPQLSREADVYAYGMTVLEVLTGKLPYEGTSSDHRLFVLVAVEKSIPTRPEANMPDDLWALLKSCWNQEPSQRPKIAGVRDSLQALSWFPSDPQSTKGATADHTGPRSTGSVEGPKQVRHYARSKFSHPSQTSVPAITIHPQSNDSSVSSAVARTGDEDKRNEPSEFRMDSLGNEPLDYDGLPNLDLSNHYHGPPSTSARHYDGLPAPYNNAPSSSRTHAPGMGLEVPGLPNLTKFDGELDSLKYNPTNNTPTRSNPLHTSHRASANLRPPPPLLSIITTPESSSQPNTQQTASSNLAPPSTTDKSPGTSHPGVPGSDLAARMAAGLSAGLSRSGGGLGRSSKSVPAPAPAPAARPDSQHPGAKERKAEKAREEAENVQQRELEKSRELELEKAKECELRREEHQRDKAKYRQERAGREREQERANEREAEAVRQRELEEIRQREFEKAREQGLEERQRQQRREQRKRERAERRQSAPTAPIARKSSPPRLSRGSLPAEQVGPSPAGGDRQAIPDPHVPHIVHPPPHIVLPPTRIVEPPAKTVEGPTKPQSTSLSQPRGHDEMGSKKTTPTFQIKSMQQQPSSVPALAPAPPAVVPVARASSLRASQASAHPAHPALSQTPTASTSRPEINRVRNTLGPTPQVPMTGVSSPRQPRVISSQPPPLLPPNLVLH